MVLVQDLVVDAQHDRGVEVVLGRGAQDHPLGAGVDVLLQAGAIGEPAGRLERDLAAELLPRQGGRVFLGRDRDLLAVDHDALLARLDRSLEPPLHAVVLEQERQVLGVRQVVDRHDVKIRGRSARTRNTSRPIRPNPLIPTRNATTDLLVFNCRKNRLNQTNTGDFQIARLD